MKLCVQYCVFSTQKQRGLDIEVLLLSLFETCVEYVVLVGLFSIRPGFSSELGVYFSCIHRTFCFETDNLFVCLLQSVQFGDLKNLRFWA